MNAPFDTKQAKEYYRKKEFAVPANLDLKKLDPMAQFEVEEVETPNQQQRVNQLNAAAHKFTNHAIVSFIASIDLFPNAPPNEGKIYSMICSQKQPVQLLAIDNFDINQVETGSVNVTLKFQVEDVHSQLLSYISKNFTYLMYEPEIRHLSKDDFRLILRHKYLNVTQEDEVVKAICFWLEGQTMMLEHPKYAKVPKKSQQPWQRLGDEELCLSSEREMNPHDQRASQTVNDLISDLNEILANVNWDYTSLPCILDTLRNEPLIRKCPAF